MPLLDPGNKAALAGQALEPLQPYHSLAVRSTAEVAPPQAVNTMHAAPLVAATEAWRGGEWVTAWAAAFLLLELTNHVASSSEQGANAPRNRARERQWWNDVKLASRAPVDAFVRRSRQRQ
jgi:hypothetical protein